MPTVRQWRFAPLAAALVALVLVAATFSTQPVVAERMMHTNHMSAEATANMRPGMSFGMDFMIYDDPAAAGEPHAPGAYYWLGIDGTWFWIDPALDLAFVGMLQHQGRAQAQAHGLSRNWVYQAIVD